MVGKFLFFEIGPNRLITVTFSQNWSLPRQGLSTKNLVIGKITFLPMPVRWEACVESASVVTLMLEIIEVVVQYKASFVHTDPKE